MKLPNNNQIVSIITTDGQKHEAEFVKTDSLFRIDGHHWYNPWEINSWISADGTVYKHDINSLVSEILYREQNDHANLVFITKKTERLFFTSGLAGKGITIEAFFKNTFKDVSVIVYDQNINIITHKIVEYENTEI